jgi:hypothetical protein
VIPLPTFVHGETTLKQSVSQTGVTPQATFAGAGLGDRLPSRCPGDTSSRSFGTSVLDDRHDDLAPVRPVQLVAAEKRRLHCVEPVLPFIAAFQYEVVCCKA